jgi:hypothetical protein
LPDQGEPNHWLPSKKGINMSPEMWRIFKNLIVDVDDALRKKS